VAIRLHMYYDGQNNNSNAGVKYQQNNLEKYFGLSHKINV